MTCIFLMHQKQLAALRRAGTYIPPLAPLQIPLAHAHLRRTVLALLALPSRSPHSLARGPRPRVKIRGPVVGEGAFCRLYIPTRQRMTAGDRASESRTLALRAAFCGTGRAGHFDSGRPYDHSWIVGNSETGLGEINGRSPRSRLLARLAIGSTPDYP
jgi:hypothetical protein